MILEFFDAIGHQFARIGKTLRKESIDGGRLGQTLRSCLARLARIELR